MENKHLTLDERNLIELELGKNTSFHEIAKYIGKDPSTISKEVKKHRVRKNGQAIHIGFNHCANKADCHKRNLCNPRCNKECKSCNNCNNVCPDFEEGICFRLKRAPYVCNGCSQKYSCKLTKYYYRALPSYNSYKSLLSDARKGINLDELELDNLDKIVSPLIKQGQSISHICKTQDIPLTRSTLYNYMSKNCFSVGPIDLPRKVRMKKRKQKRTEPKDTAARLNRTYDDFLKYVELHPELPIVEMDTVEGTKGGKVLLTLLFRSSRLMLAFLLETKTQKEVLRVFNFLEQTLGSDLFSKTFPIILTDNGTEFSAPASLEVNAEGFRRTNIFFCNPRASYQKGMLEKNHEFIRYVLPKKTTFNNLSQADVYLIINHINSLGRNSLNWSSPYDLGKIFLGGETLKKLNLQRIPSNEIQLSPKILKKK